MPLPRDDGAGLLQVLLVLSEILEELRELAQLGEGQPLDVDDLLGHLRDARSGLVEVLLSEELLDVRREEKAVVCSTARLCIKRKILIHNIEKGTHFSRAKQQQKKNSELPYCCLEATTNRQIN